MVKGLAYWSDSQLKSTAETGKQNQIFPGAWWKSRPLRSLCWGCCVSQQEAHCLSLDCKGSIRDKRASNLLITIHSNILLWDKVCTSSPLCPMAAALAPVCIYCHLPRHKQLLELDTIQLFICWSMTSLLKREDSGNPQISN